MMRRLACLLALLAGCSSDLFGHLGCGEGALAMLDQAEGPVQRDHAAQRERWSAASVGARFDEGDGLRTGKAARALLRVGRSGKAQVEPETTIRFFGSSGADAAPRLGVESGQATIETADEEVPIETQLGAAVIRKGSRVRIEGAADGARFRVLMGGAAVPARGGGQTELAEGEAIAVGIGIAVLDTSKKATSAGPSAATAAEVAAAPPDARVQAVARGQVRRRAHQATEWDALAPGDATDLGTGDELEVGRGAEASLRRGEEQATVHEGHYRIGAPTAAMLQALNGRLELAASHADVVIEVPGGTIVARAAPGGSRAGVVVRGEDGSTEVEALSGAVLARGAQGTSELARGEHATLKADDTTSVRTLDAEEHDREQDSEHGKSSGRSVAETERVDHPDLSVPLGETFRVYDANPPSAIVFPVPASCGSAGAQLEIEDMDPARGERSIAVRVGPGLRKYALRCLENGVASAKSVVRGSVRVVRNDGARKLPTSAPRNDVELDGKRYTIMYQNLRPILNVSWPGAPGAKSYVLQVQGPSGPARRLNASSPQKTVPSNLLQDGVHRLRFEATAPKPASSKETSVEIVFDNAAPTGSLELPEPAGFTPGASTRVSGVAVEGSRVSVNGREIPLDSRQRFDAVVPLLPGQRALAVRFAHPKHGVRYYLRRAAAGSQ